MSYQYQRSRNSAASATKNIGMPLASASSITVGSSNLTLADSRMPSSVRSSRNWVTSVAGACAVAGRAGRHSSQHAQHDPERALKGPAQVQALCVFSSNA